MRGRDGITFVQLILFVGSYSVRVTVAVAANHILPPNSTLTCQTLALLFNVGINEQATLAETFGQVKLQDDINTSSFYKLENYVTSRASIEDAQLVDQLSALKSGRRGAFCCELANCLLFTHRTVLEPRKERPHSHHHGDNCAETANDSVHIMQVGQGSHLDVGDARGGALRFLFARPQRDQPRVVIPEGIADAARIN